LIQAASCSVDNFGDEEEKDLKHLLTSTINNASKEKEFYLQPSLEY